MTVLHTPAVRMRQAQFSALPRTYPAGGRHVPRYRLPRLEVVLAQMISQADKALFDYRGGQGRGPSGQASAVRSRKHQQHQADRHDDQDRR